MENGHEWKVGDNTESYDRVTFQYNPAFALMYMLFYDAISTAETIDYGMIQENLHARVRIRDEAVYTERRKKYSELEEPLFRLESNRDSP